MPRKKKSAPHDDGDEAAFEDESEKDQDEEMDDAGFHVAEDEGDEEGAPAKKPLAIEADEDYESGPRRKRAKAPKRGLGLLDDLKEAEKETVSEWAEDEDEKDEDDLEDDELDEDDEDDDGYDDDEDDE